MTTVGQVYQRAEYLAERRAVLEAWAMHVNDCADPRAANFSANIIALKGI